MSEGSLICANGLQIDRVVPKTRDVRFDIVFGLTSQFRRAAVSIPANIAEGFRRRGASGKARFFNIAQASLVECRYYLILARNLEYADTREENSLIQEVSKLLDAYSKNILNSDS